MNINIKATNVDMSDALRQYAFKRLEGIDVALGVSDSDFSGQLELAKTTNHHKSGDIFKAEASLKAKGHTLYVVAEKDDLYKALDEMHDELISEAQKIKGKQRSLVRKAGQKVKNFVKKFFKY